MRRLVPLIGMSFILLTALTALAQEAPVQPAPPEPVETTPEAPEPPATPDAIDAPVEAPAEAPGETVEALPVDPNAPKPPAEPAKPVADGEPGETVDAIPTDGVAADEQPGDVPPETGVTADKLPGDAIPTDPPPVAEKKKEEKPKKEKKSKAFKGGELFAGRFVKQPPGAKTFAIGLTVQAAPFNLLLTTARDALMDQATNMAADEACKDAADKTACKEGVAQGADMAMNAMASVPDDQWNEFEAALADPGELNAALDKLEADGAISAADKQEVAGYTDDLPSGQVLDALTISRQLSQADDAMSVLVEPNLDLNFKLLALSFKLPIATYYVDNEANWNLGNAYGDLKFGHVFGPDLAAFGISYGVSVYAPTGTRKASAMALSDLTYGPKFMHEYLTTSPYLVLGFDLPIITLQGYGEYVNMYPARNADLTNMQYIKYGGSVVFLSRMFLSIIAEVNGLQPLDDNSKMYKAIFGLVGLRLRLLWLRAGIAVQIPIPGYGPEPEDMGTIAGVELGELAQWSVLGKASLTF
jgi:hypothetical protein